MTIMHSAHIYAQYMKKYATYICCQNQYAVICKINTICTICKYAVIRQICTQHIYMQKYTKYMQKYANLQSIDTESYF